MTNTPKQSPSSSNASTHPGDNAHTHASKNEETDTPSPSRPPDIDSCHITQRSRYVRENTLN